MADKIFPKKYMKKLDDFAEGYVATAESANTEELKKFILLSEQSIYEIEHEIENNANLLKQKEELKNDMAPFTEAKQTEMAKIKFCLFTLESRGVRI
jgi:hypothetical protein